MAQLRPAQYMIYRSPSQDLPCYNSARLTDIESGCLLLTQSSNHGQHVLALDVFAFLAQLHQLFI